MEWVKRQDLEAVGDSQGSRETDQGQRPMVGPFPLHPNPWVLR